MALVDDLHELEGYKRCRHCGGMVLDVVAFQTGHLCLDCFDEGLADLRVVEVMHRGSKVPIAMGSRKKSKRKKPSDTKRAAEHAKRSAWRRLAAIHPELFAMLYDEERHLRGLGPIIRRDRHDGAKVASETLTFLDVYDALRSSGETDA